MRTALMFTLALVINITLEAQCLVSYHSAAAQDRKSVV